MVCYRSRFGLYHSGYLVLEGLIRMHLYLSALFLLPDEMHGKSKTQLTKKKVAG